MDKFYTSIQALRKKYQTDYPVVDIESMSATDFKKWQNKTREALNHVLSLEGENFVCTEPELVKTEQFEDFTREKYLLETADGSIMPFYLLKPNQKKALYIPIIAAHGHCSGGKMAVVGQSNGNEELEKEIEQHNYDYGAELARRGYMVFCPDARGFGERREYDAQSEKDITGSSCNYLNNISVALGRSLAGYWVSDLKVLVDYILTRSDVNGKKLGAVGLSGGGYQSLFLSAVDQRIFFTVCSGYFYGFKESILDSSQCACNYIPGLWSVADMGHIGALVAPRNLMIETGSRDNLNGKSGLDNVIPQANFVKKAMELSGDKNSFLHHIFDGVHMWEGKTSYDWIEKITKQEI